ncbi:MAG: glycoside-pentoside-hexuronide (GPH):cation symporter [Lachnospiraceae bacterium]|nr:glycoside-pentoside-hexuronide (GPH):cation symporter [Lachnospiraceae bacterium]
MSELNEKGQQTTATHGITTKEKMAYACGDFGGVLTFSLISSFLTMFYTDCMHIPLAQITVLMLIARVWDAINDPLWGGFIDSRKPTKYGRFRPYVMWASVPLAIAAALMFFKIPGLTANQYLIYAYVTYILYGMMYTGVNIPYGSLASVITDDPRERSSLSVWRSVGAGFGNVPSMILLPLLVYSQVVDEATGESVKVLDSNKMFFAVLAISVLSVGIYALHFKGTKERVQLPPSQKREGKMHIFRTVGDLLKNPPFIFLCITSMLLIAFQMYTQTTYNYLFKNFYQQPNLYSFVTVCTYVPMALFLPIIGKLVVKYGKKEICAFGLAFAAVINFIMYGIGFTSLASNPMVFMVLLFLSGAGQTFLTLEVWALVMDVIDYHELKTGRREEGTSYALYSFTRKLGQTLAGVGVPVLLAVIGYNVEATAQTAEVTNRLYTMATLVPAIVLVVMFVCLFFGYSLSKPKLQEMYKELETKRAKEMAE